MTQQVSSPPEKTEQPPVSQPLVPVQEAGFSRPAIVIWLAVIGMLLLLFTGQMARSLPQLMKSPLKTIVPVPHVIGIVPSTGSDVIQIPGHASKPPVQLPTGRSIIYEMQNTISVLSTTTITEQPRVLATPGYIYNRSISPILTPNGQILYSGNGLWLTGLSGGTPLQIATLPDNQVITSLALSSDGTTVAWSTQPLDGNGEITIYAGPLKRSVLVYQHSATDCPCFRVFSFFKAAGKRGNSTLLLADDRGNHRAVQYGLWSLTLTPLGKPHQLLSSTQTAGPLALAPDRSTLLYSSYEGFIPTPIDESAPTDTTSLTYANSLNIATLSGTTPTMSANQVVLPAQNELSNSEAYHWETTPRFTPDGRQLLYIEFSSDSYPPYNRHGALYSVQVHGSGAHLTVGTPQLIVTTPAHFIELGAWLNSHIITFYADGSLYAFDIQNNGYKQLINTSFYTHIVAVGSQGSH